MTNFNIELSEDTYYKCDYSALYTTSGAETFCFEYKEGVHKIIFQSIKRKISEVAGVKIEGDFYDLETAYGYGGPVSNCDDAIFFANAFKAYKHECASQSIVCEFIRFHPFNPLCKHSELYDFHSQERTVVIVNLELSTEGRWAKYSKTTRNILRKANKKLQRVKESNGLDDFCKLYELTMKKNNASEFYFFQKEYFNQLNNVSGVELLSVELDGETVSTGFFMHGKEIAHYHLSANNSDLLRENGNYALLDYAFENAKEKGCRWMMLGGGRTSDENDSLFKFKTKFSDQVLPFYIAGLDFLPEKRAELNAIWKTNNNDNKLNMFQLYRM
ncbi:GNAT family N-acetyltransferase [Psychromonas hadalis]|uniref:GNAT family N-acetyltransferase n=1 Tax=Psychromonas hadalis TaxID=211669 RepID=UPI0003B476E0|nr:GNAT family N-acetyltransferase [Psychromonas hadalis]